jgi:hypothetical protein
VKQFHLLVRDTEIRVEHQHIKSTLFA